MIQSVVCYFDHVRLASAGCHHLLLARTAGFQRHHTTFLPGPHVLLSGVTRSLKNLLGSVVAGGAVLGAIVLAIGGISSFDPVARGRK